jgi:VanZ family protein
MQFRRHIARPLFWAATLFAYVAAILPQSEAPKISSSDKLEHMLAFFTISVLARIAYPAVSVRATWLVLAAFGAFIEFTQMIPALHRDAQMSDWVADVIALSVGMIVVMVGERLVLAQRRGS